MRSIYVVFTLVALFSICECLHRTIYPRNFGKFRRDLERKLESPGRYGDVPQFDQQFLKNSANKDAKAGLYSNQIEKSLTALKSSPYKKVHSGIRKVLQDYFDKIGRRPALDKLQLAWQPNEVAQLNIPSNTVLKEKLSLTNASIKKPLSASVLSFKEGPNSESDGSWQPSTLKDDALNILAKTLFGRPLNSNYSKTLDTNNPLITTCSIKINHGNGLPENLEARLNKNISDVSSLVKPDILARTSFLTILGNKNITNPFQQMTAVDKTNKDMIGNKVTSGSMVTHENIFHNKPSQERPNEGYRSKIGSMRINEEESIKSARRLFDVIQSQNPLDLLNIPVIMNSFTLYPNKLNSKASENKLDKHPIGSVIYEVNDATQTNLLSDITTQKCVFPLDLQNEDNTHIANSQSLNDTWEKSYVPWDPLSTVLSQGMGNLSLILIPFNRIRFDSFMPNSERMLDDVHINKSENKVFTPFSDEMHKINQIQDVFTKHFNDLNLKDFMDMKPPKLGSTKDDAVNLFSAPTLKKPDEMDFQKRVEDFFKMARLNSSDLPQFDSRSSKNDPENVEARTKDLINIFNSSHFVLDPKKSNFHGQSQSLLPLLKVTANMALTKYCNSPPLEEKKTNNLNSITSSSSFHASNETSPTLKNQTIDSNNLSESTNKSTKILETSAKSRSQNLNLELNSKNAIIPTSNLNSTKSSLLTRDEDESTLTSGSIITLNANSSTNQPKANIENKFSQNSIDKTADSTGHESLSEGVKLSTGAIEKEVVAVPNADFVESNNKLSVNLTTNNTPLNEELPLIPQVMLNNDVKITTTEMVDIEESNDKSSFGKTEIDPLKTSPRLNDKGRSLETLMNTRSVARLKEALSSMVQDETNDLAKWPKPYDSQSDLTHGISQPSQLSDSVDKSLNNLSKVQPYASSIAGMNTNTIGLVSNIISSFNGTKYSLSNITRKNIEQAPGLDRGSKFSQSMNFNPSLQITQDVNSTSKFKIFHSNKPDTVVASTSKKKDNSDWESDHQAPYYLSNKSHKTVEDLLNTNTKSISNCRIPSILIEILNRMESIVNGSTGYDMVIVPSKNQDGKDNLHAIPILPIAFEEMTSKASKKGITGNTSVKPKILLTTEAYQSSKSDNMFTIVTTELPESLKTDNIYQVMILRNDSKHLSSKDRESLVTTPSANSEMSEDVDEKTEGYNLTIPDGLSLLQHYRNFPESRPLILVAIDPLKAYDYFSTLPMGHSNEPVGVYIKTDVVANTPEPNPVVKGSIAQIGEPEPFCAPFTVELKCTTPCVIETKYKPVTVFPIYPMYPVYPLKPIIVGNATAKQRQDSENQR